MLKLNQEIGGQCRVDLSWRRVKGPSKSAAIHADLMNLWKYYYLAKDLDEALHALSESGDGARLIAGGTDLLIDLQQGRHTPVQTLVDITNIPELNCLEIRGNRLFIGAAMPLKRIIENELMWEHARAVVEACRLVGGPQVRNVATLGGNVAHALPGADGTIALLAMNAIAEIKDRTGLHEASLLDLFAGPGQSALRPKEDILTGFYLALRGPHQASRFERVMRPQGVALPILNIAVWVEREKDALRDVRIALGPAGPVPRRATAAEDVLRSKGFTQDSIHLAYQALLQQLTFRSSPLRASADYRKHLSETLFRNAVQLAFERAIT